MTNLQVLFVIVFFNCCFFGIIRYGIGKAVERGVAKAKAEQV